jgi:uncharacterized protein (TIGR03435 family)
MLKFIVGAVALASAAIAPAQAAGPAFEVASVKAAAPCCAPGQWRESKILADRIDFRYVTLRYCLAFAYRMKEFQISGPPWLGEARYDIVAKGPEGTKGKQLPEMMQGLLAERFQLQAHREKKEFNVFALVVGKNGPKLKESPPSADPTASPSFGIGMSGAVGHMEAKNATMTALANTLPRFVGRPVVNLTKLDGRYDFDVEFSPEDLKGVVPPPPMDPGSSLAQLGVSIFTSIQRVGLKLESQKLPLDTIVVDRAEKTPTAN